MKTKLNDEWEAKLTSSNKEHALDLEWKPTDMNKDGHELEVEFEAKCQPAKETW